MTEEGSMLFCPQTAPVTIRARLKIVHYSKKIEEQTFNIRFFRLVSILGAYVLSGETSKVTIHGS